MPNQNKLFIDALTGLVAGLARRVARHQAHRSAGIKNHNPERKGAGQHYHESWELKVPLKGRLRCRFDKRNLDLQQNSVLLIAPQNIHYGTTSPEVHHCAIWFDCLFENGDIQLCLRRSGNPMYYFLSSDQKSELTTILGRPANEFCEHIALVLERANKTTAQQMAGQWLSIFFLSLINAIAVPPVSSPLHEIVSRTIAMLNNVSYDATMTVRRMARMLNISPKYLSVVFRRITGVTVRQQLIRIRLERAFRQLQTGRFTVKEVAAFTGWQNQFYFSNSFRRYYGIAPSQVPVRMKKPFRIARLRRKLRSDMTASRL